MAECTAVPQIGDHAYIPDRMPTRGVLWTLFIDFITDEECGAAAYSSPLDTVLKFCFRTAAPWRAAHGHADDAPDQHRAFGRATAVQGPPFALLVLGQCTQRPLPESFSDLHNELGVTDLITLQRKSQIVTDNPPSMVNETPLLERMSRGL